MTKYDPHKHHRRSIRLKGYDYSAEGAYFVTICVKGGQSSLGSISDGVMTLSEFGAIVQRHWEVLPNYHPQIVIDAFVIMPNHIHCIIFIVEVDGIVVENNRPKDLAEVIRSLKSYSAHEINKSCNVEGSFWQRNYYERIVRNERELNAIREYIHNNPAAWQEDKLHPDAEKNQFNRDW